MKILVVDDEAPARERLCRLLDELDEQCVGEAGNGDEALAMVRQHHPDAVLLDIRMPSSDGMEVARSLRDLPEPPAVIFTTAFSEHAVEAFETRASDYLLKPVRKERLREALARVTPKDRRHLKIQNQGNVTLLPLEQVIYLHAESKYVLAYHDEGVAILDDSLKQIEEQFDDFFLRIHRSTLVAKQRLRGLQKGGEGGYVALLEGSDERPEISRRHTSEVRDWLKQQSV